MADYYTHYSFTVEVEQDAVILINQALFLLDDMGVYPEPEAIAEACAESDIVKRFFELWDKEGYSRDEFGPFDSRMEVNGENKPYLWINSDADGMVDTVVYVLQIFIRAGFIRESLPLSFDWGNDCSKLRIGAFGGGAVVFDGNRAVWMTTGQWMKERTDEWNTSETETAGN